MPPMGFRARFSKTGKPIKGLPVPPEAEKLGRNLDMSKGYALVVALRRASRIDVRGAATPAVAAGPPPPNSAST